jgi:hypothetical protein
MKYYCIHCKMITDTENVQTVVTTSKRPMLKGICKNCKKIKTQFTSFNNKNKIKSKVVTNKKSSKKKGGLIFTLPALVAGATALGSLAGGASALAKTINEKKAAQKQLEETRRHNLQMEKGKGLFLAPYPRRKTTGEGLYLKPFKK